MRVTDTLWVLWLCAVLVIAVKEYLFKNCENSGFCRRNQHYAKQIHTSSDSPYYVDPESVSLDANVVSGVIIKTLALGASIDLPFELSLLKGNNIRLKIDEDRSNVRVPKVNTKRYGAAQAAFDEDESAKLQQLTTENVRVSSQGVIVTYGENSEYAASLGFGPIALTVFHDDEPEIIVNERSLLNVEHYRKEKDNSKHINTALETDFDMFHDSFEDSKQDSMPLGPESIAIDVTFKDFTHVYGIPEHADSLSLRNTKGSSPYRLFNVDIFEYETESRMPMYGAIPLMVGIKPNTAVGVFWVNSADTFVDIDKSDSTRTHWMLENGVLDLVILVGETPYQINKNYAELTGFVDLPQLFALGYHQCRWNYNDESDVLEVSAKMDEYQIPYDTIWLDIEYTDKKKYFTWHPDNFPHPLEMLETLDHTGRNLVVIIDPHMKTEYEVSDHLTKEGLIIKSPTNDTYKGHCWPGESVWIDSLNPSSQRYWDNLFEYSSKNPFLGKSTNVHLWNDMNEPSFFNGPETSSPRDNLHYGDWEHRSVHNLWGKSFHELTYESLVKRLEDTPRQRPFILTRSYFAGSQRTAAMWTGDNMAKWEYLKISIPMVLTSNVVGMPFAGADVGGFFGDPSKALLARWYQAGIWYPFFRAHAHIDSRRREPWVPGEPYTSVIRDAVRLRYALLPTLYTAFHESSTKGTPVWTPMVYQNPENPLTYEIDDQFFLGDTGLMVKPVTEEDASEVTIYIPDTEVYYDYTNGQVQGASTKLSKPGYVTKKVALSDIPLFLKGGSIIARKDRYRRSSKLMKNDPYLLVIALDKLGQASGVLYVDDGESFDYKKGKSILVDFKASTKGVVATVVTEDADYSETLAGIKIEKISVLGLGSVSSVTVSQSGESWSSAFEQDGVLTIKNPGMSISSAWEVEYGLEAQHDEL